MANDNQTQPHAVSHTVSDFEHVAVQHIEDVAQHDNNASTSIEYDDLLDRPSCQCLCSGSSQPTNEQEPISVTPIANDSLITTHAQIVQILEPAFISAPPQSHARPAQLRRFQSSEYDADESSWTAGDDDEELEVESSNNTGRVTAPGATGDQETPAQEAPHSETTGSALVEVTEENTEDDSSATLG